MNLKLVIAALILAAAIGGGAYVYHQHKLIEGYEPLHATVEGYCGACGVEGYNSGDVAPQRQRGEYATQRQINDDTYGFHFEVSPSKKTCLFGQGAERSAVCCDRGFYGGKVHFEYTGDEERMNRCAQ
jgi:hypothetical protein